MELLLFIFFIEITVQAWSARGYIAFLAQVSLTVAPGSYGLLFKH